MGGGTALAKDYGQGHEWLTTELLQAEITRSKDEAREIIREHEEKIKKGDITLGELAKSESDCSSARKRGDLGYFGKGDMQKEVRGGCLCAEARRDQRHRRHG